MCRINHSAGRWLACWLFAAVLAAATWLQGSSGKGGILANVRDLLWIPLQQASQQAKQAPCLATFWRCFSALQPHWSEQHDILLNFCPSIPRLSSPLQRACRRVSLDVFAHLLNLDHSFHLGRNTGGHASRRPLCLLPLACVGVRPWMPQSGSLNLVSSVKPTLQER